MHTLALPLLMYHNLPLFLLIESCEIGRLTLEHGETKELDCLAW